MKFNIRLICLFAAVGLGAAQLGSCKPEKKPGGSSARLASSNVVSNSDSGAVSPESAEASAEPQPGQSSSRRPSQSASAGSEADPQAGVKMDFKGKTFVIATPWSSSVNPKFGESEYGDRLLRMYDEVERKYNCNIGFKEFTTYDQFINEFNAAMLAGNYFADIIECQMWQGREWVRKGYFQKLNGLKNLDINQKKFLSSKTKLSAYGGDYYGTDFTSWYFRYINFNGGGLLFNTRLLKSINENPYALIKNGKWTPEKLREIAKKLTKDLNGDDKPDVWGIAGIDPIGTLWSTGKRIATWDSSKNKWVYGLANTTVYNSLQWYLDMMYVDKSVSYDWANVTPHYGLSTLFAKGKAAFLPMDMEWMTYGDSNGAWLENMEDEYGFIPYPLANGNTSGQYRGNFGGEIRLFYIPATVTKDKGKTVEDVAFFFDRITVPLSGTNSEIWKTYVKDEFFRGNQESFDWYYHMLYNGEYDRSVDAGPLQLLPLKTTLLKMFLERSYSPAEGIALERQSFNTYLDEFVNIDPKLYKQ